jgi:hypothetical protein
VSEYYIGDPAVPWVAERAPMGRDVTNLPKKTYVVFAPLTALGERSTVTEEADSEILFWRGTLFCDCGRY